MDAANVLAGFADLLGSLVCHQLPSRTLYADALPLPVCARDMGIYLGIFVAAAFILFSGRGRADRPPGIPEAIVMCGMMLPMIIDGAGSYLGAYATNNTARLLTGVLFGLPVPFFLMPAANFKLNGRNGNAVLKSFVELAGVTAAALAICLLILADFVPYVVLASVFVLSFLFLIGRISYTIAARSFRAGSVFKYLISTGLTLCILTVLYLFSSLVLQPLKAVILR
jgi:uncharacterized membrane protein